MKHENRHVLKRPTWSSAAYQHLQDEGGVDFRELGTTSPKLEDEFAPSLLDTEKSLT